MKKYLTVYCGSSTGSNSIYKEQAKELGRIMVQNDYHLIYGAGNVGLMGIIADEVLRLGSEVIGVMELLNKVGDQEFSHEDVQIATALATQAAIAIENARLLEEVQQAYDELAELDRLKSEFVSIKENELAL